MDGNSWQLNGCLPGGNDTKISQLNQSGHGILLLLMLSNPKEVDFGDFGAPMWVEVRAL